MSAKITKTINQFTFKCFSHIEHNGKDVIDKKTKKLPGKSSGNKHKNTLASSHTHKLITH